MKLRCSLVMTIVLAGGALVAPFAAQATPSDCEASTAVFGQPGYTQEHSRGRFCLSSRFDANHYAIFQSDGNFVVYSELGGHTHATWSSGTAGRGRYIDLQSDGNLVVYGVSATTGLKVALWNSHTQGAGSRQLTMQDDGNLVIYRTTTKPAVAVWASGTAGK